MAAVLRDGISHHPQELELYLTLGQELERGGDGEGALAVYCSFPPPLHGAPPRPGHAVAATRCRGRRRNPVPPSRSASANGSRAVALCVRAVPPRVQGAPLQL